MPLTFIPDLFFLIFFVIPSLTHRLFMCCFLSTFWWNFLNFFLLPISNFIHCIVVRKHSLREFNSFKFIGPFLWPSVWRALENVLYMLKKKVGPSTHLGNDWPPAGLG